MMYTDNSHPWFWVEVKGPAGLSFEYNTMTKSPKILTDCRFAVRRCELISTHLKDQPYLVVAEIAGTHSEDYALTFITEEEGRIYNLKTIRRDGKATKPTTGYANHVQILYNCIRFSRSISPYDAAPRFRIVDLDDSWVSAMAADRDWFDGNMKQT